MVKIVLPDFYMFMCLYPIKNLLRCVPRFRSLPVSEAVTLCVHPCKALWKFTRKGHRRDLLDKGFSNKGLNRHNQCLVTVQNQGQGNKWTRYPRQWNKNLTGKCYLHPSATLSGIGSTRSHVCSVQCSSLFRSLRVSWWMFFGPRLSGFAETSFEIFLLHVQLN